MRIITVIRNRGVYQRLITSHRNRTGVTLIALDQSAVNCPAPVCSNKFLDLYGSCLTAFNFVRQGGHSHFDGTA